MSYLELYPTQAVQRPQTHPFVRSTGKRLLLALDVSPSMRCGWVAGVPRLTPLEVAASIALATAVTELRYEIVGFYRGRKHACGLTPLAVWPGQRVDDLVRRLSELPFEPTDCALPMRYAQARRRKVDTFVVVTDSEPSIGDVHPAQALCDYRRASGIDARLVVLGLVSRGFSIADPADPGMLDLAGFDAATPELISAFARGLF